MKRSNRFLKLFLIITLSTTYIFSFSHFGAKAFGTLTSKTEIYARGTTIGSFAVEGMNGSEAEAELTKKYSQWREQSTLTLRYKEKSVTFPLTHIVFKIEETVSSVKDGMTNQLEVLIEKTLILEEVSKLSASLNEKNLDVERIKGQLIEVASQMTIGETSINISDFLLEGQHQQSVISENSTFIDENVDEMNGIVESLSPIVIPAQGTFSLLDHIQKQRMEGSSSATLSVIATGIYNSILPTNFMVLERNIGDQLPKYAELGFEAKIDIDNGIDFVFSNPNLTDYELELEWDGEKLIVRLIGETLLYEYKTIAKNKQEYVAKTIKQFSPHLLSGQKKVNQKGENGLLINVYRETYDRGQLLKSEPISEDYYAPIPQIEVHSLPISKPVSSTGGDSSNTPITNGTDSNEYPIDANPIENSDEKEGSQDDSSSEEDKQSENQIDDSLWGKPNEEPK